VRPNHSPDRHPDGAALLFKRDTLSYILNIHQSS
jgi:hypothetical protein